MSLMAVTNINAAANFYAISAATSTARNDGSERSIATKMRLISYSPDQRASDEPSNRRDGHHARIAISG